MPTDSVVSLLEAVFTDTPGAVTCVVALAMIAGVSLGLACRAVERREYVLEQ
jgi:hypothetical protein